MTDATQMLKMRNGTLAVVGKPYLWKSNVYGDVAVHITGFSPNENIALISIDGGEASTQAQRFPELSDGKYFVVLNSNRLVKRPTRSRTTKQTATPDPGAHFVETPPVLREQLQKAARKAKTPQDEVTF